MKAKDCRCNRSSLQNVCKTGCDFDIHIHYGAGAYICGEETALLESRRQSVVNQDSRCFPALAALYGCPTIVNRNYSGWFQQS